MLGPKQPPAVPCLAAALHHGGAATLTNLAPHAPTAQGACTTLGGLCILDAKQLGRILYGSGPWVKLSLVNMRLVNGNSRDSGEPLGGSLVGEARSGLLSSCLGAQGAAWHW